RIDHVERLEAGHDALRVAPDRREDRRHEPPPELARHRDHHPEIAHHPAYLRGDHHVSRVRVRVEEAVDQHHPQVQLHDGAHDAARILRAFAVTALQPVDSCSLDVFQYEDPWADQLVDHARYHDARIPAEVRM